MTRTGSAPTRRTGPSPAGQPWGPALWVQQGAASDATGCNYWWCADVGEGEVYHRLDGPAVIRTRTYRIEQESWQFYKAGRQVDGNHGLLADLYAAGEIDTVTTVLTLYDTATPDHDRRRVLGELVDAARAANLPVPR